MARTPADPSGAALPFCCRLPPAVLDGLSGLAVRWGCTPKQAAQRAITEAVRAAVPTKAETRAAEIARREASGECDCGKPNGQHRYGCGVNRP